MKKALIIISAVIAAVIVAHCTAFVLAQNGMFQQKNDALSGKLIFIDAGHGEGSGGAFGLYHENRNMLLYANAVKNSLERCGATVVMTRTTEEDVDNYARSAAINAYTLNVLLEAETLDRDSTLKDIAEYEDSAEQELLDWAKLRLEQQDSTIAELKSLISTMQAVIEQPPLAEKYFLCPYSKANGRAVSAELGRIFEYQKDDRLKDAIFISLHSNATGNNTTRINGTVTYYMDNAMNTAYYTGYQQEKNQLLATLLLTNVSKSGGFAPKATLVNDFYMVRETNIPAALVEIAYHTNFFDTLKLTSPLNRGLIARGIVNAVTQYFNAVD